MLVRFSGMPGARALLPLVLLCESQPPHNASQPTACGKVVTTLLDLHERGDHDPARQVVPMRMGGLGLRSAYRAAEAPFWAYWADALPLFSD